MKTHACEFSVGKMAAVLGVSRSGYYASRRRGVSSRERENQDLSAKIRHIHKESSETYGSPRLHAELKAQGETCSRKRVARLMRHSGIVAKMAKRFKKTTRRDPGALASPDLVDQNFTADSPNEVWVSDITSIPTEQGWAYAAIVLDLFSRKIVGLAVDDCMTADLVVAALLQALKHRDLPAGVIHHSDRGSQYTSQAMKILAEDYGVQLSMGRVANAYDNAWLRVSSTR